MRSGRVFAIVGVLGGIGSCVVPTSPNHPVGPPASASAANSGLPEGFKTHFADIGRACDGASLAIGIHDPPSHGKFGSRFGSLCGVTGKVAGVYNPDGTYGELPAVEVLYSGPVDSADVLPGQSVIIGLADPYLWVRRVTCGRCAAVMGWGFAGHLPELEDSQLRFLQTALELPQEPVLRTARDWRRAVRRDLARSEN